MKRGIKATVFMAVCFILSISNAQAQEFLVEIRKSVV